MEDILTAEQVAQILQVHPFTVLKFIKQGKLKASKLGRVYRIRRSEVDRFLDSQVEQTEKSEITPKSQSRKEKSPKTVKTPKVQGVEPEESEQMKEQKALKVKVRKEEIPILPEEEKKEPEARRENPNDLDHYVLELKL